VEDQERADERIPLLLQTPAAKRFVSAEPLLGPVRLQDEWIELELQAFGNGVKCFPSISWLICGGESGPHARPCDLGWIRAIVDQCRTAGVAAFCKQLGSSHRCEHSSKGGCYDCFPEGLRIREMPEVG
jgi:protein gp37